MSPTVGIVGLGLLGHAVASRLLAGGHGVIGYDVLPERVRALEEFPPQMKLDLFLKDLGLVLEAGADVGASLSLTALARRLYETAAADGLGGQDLAVVATALERWRARDEG